MKKAIFTLNVDDYSPEITSITYPFIEQYADKIGADFIQIKERGYKKWPVTYEKMQIYHRGLDYDWNIYIDSDALIHPNMFDITEFLSMDTVMTYDADFAIGRFKYNKYFRRDGRHIGVGNWFTVASKLCLDLWTPASIEYKDFGDIEKIIYPTAQEKKVGIESSHLIDDYMLSCNIARFGLKHVTFLEYFKDRTDPTTFFHHNYLQSTEEKIEDLKYIASTF